MTVTISTQQPDIPQGKLTVPNRFQRQAETQLFACLAHAGRRDTLEAYSRHGSDGSATTEHQFYLALILAREGEIGEALALLRAVILKEPKHNSARRVAYRLIVQQAEIVAKEANWQKLSDLIVEAMQIHPEGVDPTIDFARFRGALPVSHLRSGQRQESARLWEQQLMENVHDHIVLHNLALMHYWWVCRVDQNVTESPLTDRWQLAIIYWALLLQIDLFWSHWSNARAQVWGFAISEEDLTVLRKRLYQEYFVHTLQDRLDDARQKNQTQLAKQYDECLNMVLLEWRSAQCWKQALSYLPAGMPVAEWLEKSDALSNVPPKLAWMERFIGQAAKKASAESVHAPTQFLDLPGGLAFFRHFDLLHQIPKIILHLSSLKGEEHFTANLRILFSPDNLGQILVYIEDRNYPVEAISMLDKVSKDVYVLPEFDYLRGLAFFRRGEQLSSQGNFNSAFEHWQQAFQHAQTAASDPTFSSVLKTLCMSIQRLVIEATPQEANKLKQADKRDEAIALLDRAMEMDKDGVLLDHLCIHLCERASAKLNNENFDGSKKDLNRVLKLKPDYERAKQIFGTIYNNEACSELDTDKSIALFEKALEWDPSSHHVKMNFARAIRSKAVDKVNSSGSSGARYAVDDAIQLLERAYNLVNFELQEGALALIREMSEADSDMVKILIEKIDNDVLKRVVEDMGIVYHMRARFRRGY